MKRKLLTLTFVLLVVALCAQQRKTLFVIVDGVIPEHIERLQPPTLMEIAQRGHYHRAYCGGEVGGYSETPTISAIGYTNILTGSSVEAVTLANNHSRDYGQKGYKRTVELLEEAGCDYRLNSPVAGAVVEDGVLKSVKILTKRGMDTFTADAFIDCTGDGDLCFHAGADMREGREGDGVTMPVTLGFSLANVDEERLFTEFYDTQNCEDSVAETIARAEADGYTVSPWYSFDRTTVPNE